MTVCCGMGMGKGNGEIADDTVAWSFSAWIVREGRVPRWLRLLV